MRQQSRGWCVDADSSPRAARIKYEEIHPLGALDYTCATGQLG